jgi:hypothetical protein
VEHGAPRRDSAEALPRLVAGHRQSAMGGVGARWNIMRRGHFRQAPAEANCSIDGLVFKQRAKCFLIIRMAALARSRYLGKLNRVTLETSPAALAIVEVALRTSSLVSGFTKPCREPSPSRGIVLRFRRRRSLGAAIATTPNASPAARANRTIVFHNRFAARAVDECRRGHVHAPCFRPACSTGNHAMSRGDRRR